MAFLTQESVLSFLLERGGKVKNAELLNHFGGLIHGGAPAAKQHNRELFKKLVNSVAVVRHIDGVKFVAVKKRYQDFVVQDESTCTRLDAAQVLYSDLENNNNNVCYPSRMKLHGTLQRSTSSTTVQVLNICGDQASGAVFAVIAVASPPKGSTPPEKVTSRSCLDLVRPVCNKNEAPQRCSNMESDDVQTPSVLRGSQNKSLNPVEEAECCGSVPLDPLAHEWLVKCAAGLWGHVHAMLLQDGRLAQKKDFMSGFTALHWAAKDGNADVIRKLVDVSRRRGVHVNVNGKAHGGYTPLHIAAIHNRTEVMLLLVRRYGASVHERDNSGKKAHHYLGRAVSEKVRALVGGVQLSKYWEKTDDEDYKEEVKGLNSISKIFQPHRKQKQATRLND